MARSVWILPTISALIVLLLWTYFALTGRPVEDSTDHVLFRDITASSKLDFVHVHGGTGKKYMPEIMGSGGCALDFDGDGWIDVYLIQSGKLPGSDYRGARVVNRLFRNLGDGTFMDATAESGLPSPLTSICPYHSVPRAGSLALVRTTGFRFEPFASAAWPRRVIR